MRSCLGSILLVIVLAFLAVTAFYQWNTNAKIEFSIRKADDPVFKTEKYPISAIKEGKVPEINQLIEKGAMTVTPAPEPASAANESIPDAEPIENIPDAEPVN